MTHSSRPELLLPSLASLVLSSLLLAVTTITTAPTSWIAIFVTVSTGVEKAIIWATKSGNRVLAEVDQRQDLYSATLSAKGLGGNEFHLGGTQIVAAGYFLNIHSGI